MVTRNQFSRVNLIQLIFYDGQYFLSVLSHLINATPEQLASIEWLSTLMLEIIIYSIVLAVVSYILLALISDGELSQPMDVREK
jgi:uncharacterized membrane protein YesL